MLKVDWSNLERCYMKLASSDLAIFHNKFFEKTDHNKLNYYSLIRCQYSF